MLNPLYTAVSWVLLRWHELFSWLGMNPDSGLNWALSIVFLVITIRLLLFRFFIKQVHSQRKMQEVQPKIAALREKYKNDRQTLSQEMMKLQKEEGFNPLGGCLPIALQAPVFISLFHVLRLIGTPQSVALTNQYGWTADQTASAGQATVFGAPIASAFSDPRDLVSHIEGASRTATHVVALVLIVLMVAATYTTQRQVMMRNTQTLDSQQAMIQRLMLYGVPASLTISGFFFPIGVLFYWFTNNLWSMGQQFYILKRMPHPNATKPGVDPEVAKALAPKPGQKPVRPTKRTAQPAVATDASSDGDPSAGTSPDGEAGSAGPGKPAPGAKPAPGVKPATRRGAGARRGSGADAGVNDTATGDTATGGTTADGTAAGNGATAAADPTSVPSGQPDVTGGSNGAGPDGPDGATAGGSADSADGSATAGGPSRSKPGPGARSGGGGRRPQGQRSPTQTRQKKKRR